MTPLVFVFAMTVPHYWKLVGGCSVGMGVRGSEGSAAMYLIVYISHQKYWKVSKELKREFFRTKKSWIVLYGNPLKNIRKFSLV